MLEIGSTAGLIKASISGTRIHSGFCTQHRILLRKFVVHIHSCSLTYYWQEINPLFDRTNLMIPCSDGFLAISTPGHICVVGCFDTKILYNFQQSSIVQPDIIAGASFTLPGNNPDTIVALIKHERSPSKNVLYTCRISADRTISALVERTKLPRPFTGEQDSIAMVLHNNQLCATINYTEGLLHRIYLSE